MPASRDPQLSSLLPIANPKDYKVHLASWNGKAQPLDVFVRDRRKWDSWNAWRSAKDDFNRPYILSLIDFYPQPGLWLFGGVYKVVARSQRKYSSSYRVQAVPEHTELVGRLKIRFTRPGRVRAIRLERYYERMTISALLSEPY